MRKILAFFVACLLGAAVYAKPDAKYKMLLGAELSGTRVDRIGTFVFGLESTHGVLISNRFFLGAGVGVDLARTMTKGQYHKEIEVTSAFPIYGGARLYLSNNTCRPYIDAKGGYVMGDAKGSFFRPSLGFSVPVNKRCAINIGFSYQLLNEKSTSPFDSQHNIKAHSFAFDWGLEF